jgi:hypothetical protein
LNTVAANNLIAYDVSILNLLQKEPLCYEFSCHIAISSKLVATKQRAHKPSTALLVIAEEDLDGQPCVTADLEAVGQRAELLHLLVVKSEVELEVVLNARGSDGLGNDRGAALETPDEEDLSSGLALGLGDLGKSLVLCERAVGAAEAGVGSAVDVLGLAVVDELGRRVVGVELDLVDGRDGLAGGVVEELLQVLDREVGNTNVLHAAGRGKLLELLPGLDEVPVGVVLLEVIGVGGGRPVHEVKVDVVHSEVLEGRGDALFHTLVPWVVKLGGDPDLLSRDAGVLDTLADLVLVAVCEGSVDVAVSSEESGLDGLADLVGLGLPGTQTNSGHLSAL